jgi:hypothetical protein
MMVGRQSFVKLLQLFRGGLREIDKQCGHAGNLAPGRLFAVQSLQTHLESLLTSLVEALPESSDDIQLFHAILIRCC